MKSNSRLKSGKKKAILFFLRFLSGVLILFALLQPTLIFRKKIPEKGRLAVLFDVSESMRLKIKNEKENLFKGIEFLKGTKGFLSTYKNIFDIDLYSFGSKVAPVELEELEKKSKRSFTTDLVNSVKQVNEIYRDSFLDGILVISDGTDNITFDENILTQNYEDVKRVVSASIDNSNARVSTIWMGQDGKYQDIFVSRVLANEFGFVKNPLKIGVEIIVKGYSDIELPVTLKEGNRIIKSEKILIKKDQEKYKLSFSILPHEMGEHLYSVSIPVLKEEILKNNNRLSFKVNIMRDKVRVMLVIGSPSWDGKFLRRFLKGESYVDLITFIILRTGKNLANVPVKELSLIPFPTDELFQKEKELYKFDLIIFVDFDYRAFMPFSFLKNIKEFVTKKGGGFLMLGGERSFRGSYRGTPLEKILPVDLFYDNNVKVEKNYIQGSYKLKLTKTGENHPFFTGKGVTSKDLKGVPPLRGVNSSLKLKDNAVVLARHPVKGNSNGKYPVISYIEAGNGKSMMLASNSSWRWNFEEIGEGGDPEFYKRFYSNAVKYLTGDPEFKRIKIDVIEEPRELLKNVSFEVTVFNSEYKPTWKLNLLGKITAPGNTTKNLKFKRTNRLGVYNVSYIPRKNGIYKVEVFSSHKGAKKESAYDFFSVGESLMEEKYLSPNGHVLKALSGITKGESYMFSSLPERLNFKDKKRYKIVDEAVFSLWDSWYILFSVIALLVIEWFIRRKAGLK